MTDKPQSPSTGGGGPFDRRDFLRRSALFGGAVAIGGPALLAACGSGGIKAKSTQTTSANALTSGCKLPAQKSDKTLAISNWPLYIDKQTVKAFTAATGIATTYKEDFNDNEEYYAKVRPILSTCKGIGKDIIVPTDWMASRMITLGWAAKIDPAKVPNRKNLLSSLQHPGFDTDRTYTMPWQSGMTGLAYNKKAFADLGIAAPRSFKDLLNPKLKGKVTFLTEMRDCVGLWMLALGKDPSKATFADATSAFDQIREAAKSGQVRRFTGNDYADDLSNGNVIAAMAWSGDVVQLHQNNANLEFVVPDEGGMLFSDNMMILATSEHVADAEAWIDYVYDPKHAAQITAEVQYISPVEGVADELKKIDAALAANPLIFPPADVQKRLHIFVGLKPAEEQQFNTAFDQILNG
jgi:spermidine/putrescine transport system substrate-binding protein